MNCAQESMRNVSSNTISVTERTIKCGGVLALHGVERRVAAERRARNDHRHVVRQHLHVPHHHPCAKFAYI